MKRWKRNAGYPPWSELRGQILDWADFIVKVNWTELKKRHPVLAAIILARVKRLNQLDGLRKKRSHNSRVDQTTAKTYKSGRQAEIRDEIRMLTTWIPKGERDIAPRLSTPTVSGIVEYDRTERDSFEPTKEEVNELAQRMRASGYPRRIVRAVLKAKRLRGRGRPALKRELAIKALEARMAKPEYYSWGRLAIDFCDCPKKKKHGFECRDRMRKTVGRLKRFLTKYRIDLPPRYGRKSV
jgi:hypothetical protein